MSFGFYGNLWYIALLFPRNSNIRWLRSLIVQLTCSFATTKIRFEPERKYSISGTFVHFCKLFADFCFRYCGLEAIDKHKRSGSYKLAFQFIRSFLYLTKFVCLPYLDGAHQRPFAGAVGAGWSWTCVFLMLLRLQTVNKRKINNFYLSNIRKSII